MTASNKAFSAFSFISFILTLIPFAWHLEAWNTGTCILMGWVSISSLILFINSVVWNGNTINWAPLYCDIATKIIIGVAAGIPASLLCINRRLYNIVCVKAVTRSLKEKRIGVLVDLGIGIGIPIIIMILHVVVQGHRFDILEDVGCQPATYNTVLTYLLVLGPTLVLSLIATAYSILNLIALKRNFAEFRQMLSSNGTNANANRYIRLMCMAGVELMWDVPLNLYAMIISIHGGVQPWISWSETHFAFNRADTFPRFQWAANPSKAFEIEILRWSIVLVGFIFFAFFGFADEAMKNYKIAYNIFARKLHWKVLSIPGTMSPHGSGVSSGRSWKSPGLSVNSAENNGKGRGVNGTESWMNSFDAFTNKVKLVVLPSGGTSLKSTTSIVDMTSSFFSRGTTTSTKKSNKLPVFVTREMIQRHDDDSTSVFTQFTDFSSYSLSGSSSAAVTLSPSLGGEDEEVLSSRKPSLVDSLLDDTHVDTPSEYSQNSPSPAPGLPATTPRRPTSTSTTWPPPTPLPKDAIYSSPLATSLTLIVPPPSALRPVHHGDRIREGTGTPLMSPHTRTPPKQTIPSSPTNTPNGSFLDLRASVMSSSMEVSSPHEVSSYSSPLADNRV